MLQLATVFEPQRYGGTDGVLLAALESPDVPHVASVDYFRLLVALHPGMVQLTQQRISVCYCICIEDLNIEPRAQF
jgi:hypothetical protein